MQTMSVKARCRAMVEDDCEMVMNWRMMPDITRYMNTDPKLTLEGQIKWFRKQKKNPDNYLWIIEIEGVPSGVLTILDIDKQNSKCGAGLYVAVKEKRSLEFTMQLEWSLYDFIFDYLGLNKFYAEIFSLNKGLIRIKQMCGSEIEGVLKQHIYKNGVYYDVTMMGILKNRWKEIKSNYSYEPIEFCLDNGETY